MFMWNNNNDAFKNGNQCLIGKSSKRQSIKQTPNKIDRSPSPHNIKFNVGHLVWAKLENHPWWPCKITRENLLDSNSSYVKLISKFNICSLFIVLFRVNLRRIKI